MGGRYGGNINGRAKGRTKPKPFFLVRLGRDTRRPFEAIGKSTRKLLPKDKSLRHTNPQSPRDSAGWL